ncbi:hypothetical protein Pelo_1871 [Pelomyxa schiedti]|nr:hypothetical protein Pelo_1871 [Pelomyxa schiedti]
MECVLARTTGEAYKPFRKHRCSLPLPTQRCQIVLATVSLVGIFCCHQIPCKPESVNAILSHSTLLPLGTVAPLGFSPDCTHWYADSGKVYEAIFLAPMGLWAGFLPSTALSAGAKT